MAQATATTSSLDQPTTRSNKLGLGALDYFLPIFGEGNTWPVILGFMIALSAYVLISILSLGIMAQPELAGLKNPSMAGVLQQAGGPWGAALVSLGMIVSVAGAFLNWTLLAAEIPFVAAKEGILPKLFAGEMASGSPLSQRG